MTSRLRIASEWVARKQSTKTVGIVLAVDTLRGWMQKPEFWRFADKCYEWAKEWLMLL